MDYDNLAPESEEEFEQRQQELLEDARNEKQQREAAQNEALKQIAEGESLEEYETVELGDLELEVKAWLPGDVEDTVLQAQQLGDSEDPAEIKRSMETMLSALAEMTTEETYDMGFWRKYYRKWGAEGLIMAVSTVLEPAGESLERKREGVDGFRTGTGGPRPSVGDGTDG
jgi:hypothetical protein